MSFQEQSKNRFEKVLSIYNGLKSEELYDSLQLNQEEAKILKLSDEINGIKFKIAVIGEFSTGKSTIINTLIQKEVLPAKYKPTTNQITIIKDSKNEYVRIENKVDTHLELTKDNVSKLDKNSNANIEIGVKLPNLADYEIYDTPGVNDPSMFSDEIVFDLIGKVDVAVFVMQATQVLKQSEIDFLTKLIRKKDIGKFFFVINQIDLIGDEKYEVRDDFLEKLSNLLKIDKDKIAKQTFLYSAKNALEAIKTADITALRESGYNAFTSGVDNYIKENKKALFEDIVDRELNQITKDTLLKIDTAIDKINNKDKEYEETLKGIEQEINEFKIQIEDAIYDFRRNFDLEKDKFKRGIDQSFNAISEKMLGEISTIPVEKLTKDRYVEIRTKKLIEDATEEEFNKFVQSIQVDLKKFNSSIEPIYNKKTIVINDLVTKNYASTIVNGIAISGTVVGAVAYLPTILTIGAVGVGASALGSVGASALSVVPHPSAKMVGAALGGVGSAVSTAGILAMQASKYAFDLAKWSVRGLGSFANSAENILKVKQYQNSVKSSIEDIKHSIIQNIDKETSADIYIDAFINEKFPQKDELEQKIEQSKKEFAFNLQDSQKIKNRLEEIKLQLAENMK